MADPAPTSVAGVPAEAPTYGPAAGRRRRVSATRGSPLPSPAAPLPAQAQAGPLVSTAGALGAGGHPWPPLALGGPLWLLPAGPSRHHLSQLPRGTQCLRLAVPAGSMGALHGSEAWPALAAPC